MRMRKFLAVALLVCGPTLLASDYLTEGVDPQRTGWMKDEKVFTTANVKDMKLLWKLKLDSTPREMHNLFPPLIAERVTTASGPHEIAVVAGVSDDLFGIDVGERQAALDEAFRQHVHAAGRRPWRRHALSRRSDGRAGDRADVTPGNYTVYAVSWDGRLRQVNLADGEDVAPPEKFMPANGKPYALNLVNGVIYTASAQGCGGVPNAFYSFDLATRKASMFTPAGGGMWGRRGAVVTPEGNVFLGTGDGQFDPADAQPRQRHRRREDRRRQAAAARGLLLAAERELDVASRSRRQHDADRVRLSRPQVPGRHEQGMPHVAARSRRPLAAKTTARRSSRRRISATTRSRSTATASGARWPRGRTRAAPTGCSCRSGGR